MDKGAEFVKLVLGYIKKHGDVHEHDAACRLMAEIPELQPPAPEEIPAIPETVGYTYQGVSSEAQTLVHDPGTFNLSGDEVISEE